MKARVDRNVAVPGQVYIYNWIWSSQPLQKLKGAILIENKCNASASVEAHLVQVDTRAHNHKLTHWMQDSERFCRRRTRNTLWYCALFNLKTESIPLATKAKVTLGKVSSPHSDTQVPFELQLPFDVAPTGDFFTYWLVIDTEQWWVHLFKWLMHSMYMSRFHSDWQVTNESSELWWHILIGSSTLTLPVTITSRLDDYVQAAGERDHIQPPTTSVIEMPPVKDVTPKKTPISPTQSTEMSSISTPQPKPKEKTSPTRVSSETGDEASFTRDTQPSKPKKQKVKYTRAVTEPSPAKPPVTHLNYAVTDLQLNSARVNYGWRLP